jgi:2'-5' RNA ligase
VRLFFALWPDDALREALGRVGLVLAARAQGKPVPAAKLHMTLAFLGEVPAERLAPAVDAAARVKGEAFELLLDEVGAFRSARVAWVGSTAGHPRSWRSRRRSPASFATRDSSWNRGHLPRT